MPPPTTDTDKQASLTTLHLASIPGLYSHLHLHTPPFQVPLDRWKALGGRVQDLRARKISARAAGYTDRSTYPDNDQGAHLSQSAKSARGVPMSLAQAKKSPDIVEAFRFRLRASLLRPR